MSFRILPLLTLFLCLGSYAAHAQSKPNDGYSDYFRGVKSSDLVTILPPRQDSNRFGGDGTTSFFSNNGGCPESVSIGSIDDSTGIRGSVDIDVNIDSDITIVCGGF